MLEGFFHIAFNVGLNESVFFPKMTNSCKQSMDSRFVDAGNKFFILNLKPNLGAKSWMD